MQRHTLRGGIYAVLMSLYSAGQRLRLVLANDVEVVVHGLAQMLAPYSDVIQVVDLDVELEEPSGLAADITLYDTFSQGQADNEGIDRVLTDDRSGRVVVYSWNTHPDLIRRALGRGVSGYLAKSLPAADLVAALHEIHRGRTVVHPTPEGGNCEPAGGDWPGRREGLTVREAEVISLITQGLANTEIATRCRLSINSVKSYIRIAYRKMGVSSRAQAVRWGVEHGMLPRRDDRLDRRPGA